MIPSLNSTVHLACGAKKNPNYSTISRTHLRNFDQCVTPLLSLEHLQSSNFLTVEIWDIFTHFTDIYILNPSYLLSKVGLKQSTFFRTLEIAKPQARMYMKSQSYNFLSAEIWDILLTLQTIFMQYLLYLLEGKYVGF